MDSIAALHAAARQYCAERSAFWRERYATLTASGLAGVPRADSGSASSTAACDPLPRYQVLAAIQMEVERFVPADFASFEESRQILAVAGETAQSIFTKQSDAVAVAAGEEERRNFSFFVRTVDDAALAAQPELPFCRVLGTSEHRELHSALARRWGNWYGGCVDRKEGVSDVVTLHVAAMTEPESYVRLAKVLEQRGIVRVFELLEFGDGYEVETEHAGFVGSESFWTSGDMDWMVYASHESSVTFGSPWLVATMRALIPEFERYIYRGYDLAEYPEANG